MLTSHSPPTATVPGRDATGIVKVATFAFVTPVFTVMST
jgi:hypothetical protein